MDELVTAVVEVEMIINSRPLTYVSTKDLEEAITPSHLISSRQLMSLPDGPYNRDISDSIVNSGDLTKRMIHLNNVLAHFWKRWKSEYLLGLKESHRSLRSRSSGGSSKPITTEDVVLIHDENRQRGFWKLGRVEDVVTGLDGNVRGATVKTLSSSNRPIILRRPVQLLYPLEVHCDTSTEQAALSKPDQPEARPDQRSDVEPDRPGVETSPSMPCSDQRPSRIAAQNVREIIRVWTEDS